MLGMLKDSGTIYTIASFSRLGKTPGKLQPDSVVANSKQDEIVA